MPCTLMTTPPPAEIGRSMGALLGLASLLACVDPLLWDSVGRPAARDLATLVFSLHGELEAGVEALLAQGAP